MFCLNFCIKILIEPNLIRQLIVNGDLFYYSSVTSSVQFIQNPSPGLISDSTLKPLSVDNDFTFFADWTSSNPAVAIVSGGSVTFKSSGKVVIFGYLEGLMASMDFTVGSVETSEHHGNLVILAGGNQNNNEDKLKDAIQYLGNRMYQVFKARGFEDDDIYYINHVNTQDFDGDGISDGVVAQTEKSVSTLQDAINWAKGKSSFNDGPLYLYLVDHGEKNGTFLIDADQVLTVTQLDAMLDEFEDQTGRISIITLEACYSGSFINTSGHVFDIVDYLVFTSTRESIISSERFGSGGVN